MFIEVLSVGLLNPWANLFESDHNKTLGMLETTLNTKFLVGTNLSGGLASADWRYLLPRLRYGRVLCLTVPPHSSLPVLHNMAKHILVVSENRAILQKLIAECRTLGIRNIDAVLIKDLSTLPIREGSIDVIYVKETRSNDGRFANESTHSEFCRLLKSSGIIFHETNRQSHSLL